MKRIPLLIFLLLRVIAITGAAQNTPPVVTAQIDDFTEYAGAAARSIDLTTAFADSDVSAAVRLNTVLGTIDIALFGQQKPITVTNFLNYVDQGRFYLVDPTTHQLASVFVHRAVSGFVVQTGGYIGTVNPAQPASVQVTQVLHFPSIQNEPGISNSRGTVAMAKTAGDPNSATSEFFINLADNGGPPNNLDTQNGGYTVFGRVVNGGMSMVDAIAALPLYNAGAPFDSIPLRNYVSPNPVALSNLVSIPSITRISPLTFSVMSNSPTLADAAVSGTKLLVTPHQAGDAQLTVTATDFDGASISQSFTVHVVAGPGRLVQLSTRMLIGTGNNVLIGGFIVSGTSPKLLVVRGLGPSTGLSGALADPLLELHDSTGAVIGLNDNWGDTPNHQDVTDLGIAPASPNESAILMSVPSSASFASYTAVVRGAGNTTGLGLVEVYDVDSGPSSTLLNLSTRGQVGLDPDALIGGFFVGGAQSKRILLRAIGPSLGASGVPNPLSDPILELRDANATLLQQNDDWGSSPDHTEIQSSGFAPGNPKESAMIQLLSPAPYTAIVHGVNNTIGVGSVEIYQLP
jgi:cyclophilin family peptidyl-prolyl cis-trans isomerase